MAPIVQQEDAAARASTRTRHELAVERGLLIALATAGALTAGAVFVADQERLGAIEHGAQLAWIVCGGFASVRQITESRVRTATRDRDRILLSLLAAGLVWTLACFGLQGLAVGDGLTARYFTNDQWAGEPVYSGADQNLSTAQMAERWHGAAPPAFSVTWAGYVTVTTTGRYRFATVSDDESWVYVDDVLVVDNGGGAHGAETRVGELPLAEGPHRVRLSYVQHGGDFELAWSWASAGGRFGAVPSWALSTRKARNRTVLAAHIISLGARSLAIVLALTTAWYVIGRLAKERGDLLGRVDVGLVAFLIAILALHAVMYARHPYRPIAPETGWEGFWDQSQYVKSARALAHADLTPTQHWYPIGYSLLAAPFVSLTPLDPFVLVNASLFLVFGGAFLIYFRPLIGYLPAACAFTVPLAVPWAISVPFEAQFPMWSQFVVPWSTIPIAALYMCVLCLMRNIESARSTSRDFWLGALSALVFVIHPIDALPLMAAGAAYLWIRLRRDQRLRHISAGLAGALGVVVPVMILTVRIHHGLDTPYVEFSKSVGMSATNLYERAYAILVSSATTYGQTDSGLLDLQPWLYLSLPLAVVWAALDAKRGLLPVMLVAASIGTYLSYNDFWPFNFLRFNLIHYIVWALPVLAATGIAGALEILRGGHWKVGALVVLFALGLACSRLVQSSVQPNGVAIHPAETGVTNYVISFAGAREVAAIDLLGATSDDPAALTMRAIRLIVDEKKLELFSGYRLIALDGGIRIIFNTRVSATRIDFDLEANLRNHPRFPPLVRPVRFRIAFAPFWRPKPAATLTAPPDLQEH